MLADSRQHRAKETIAVSTAHVLFLLVLHDHHVPAAQGALAALGKGWAGQFWRVGPDLWNHQHLRSQAGNPAET